MNIMKSVVAGLSCTMPQDLVCCTRWPFDESNSGWPTPRNFESAQASMAQIGKYQIAGNIFSMDIFNLECASTSKSLNWRSIVVAQQRWWPQQNKRSKSNDMPMSLHCVWDGGNVHDLVNICEEERAWLARSTLVPCTSLELLCGMLVNAYEFVCIQGIAAPWEECFNSIQRQIHVGTTLDQRWLFIRSGQNIATLNNALKPNVLNLGFGHGMVLDWFA